MEADRGPRRMDRIYKIDRIYRIVFSVLAHPVNHVYQKSALKGPNIVAQGKPPQAVPPWVEGHHFFWEAL